MTSETADGTPGAAPRYEADPYETRTDLMLEGFGLLKVFVGIALYIGLAVAMAPLIPRVPFCAVFPLWLALTAAAIVLLDLAAQIVAKRRGRVDERRLAQVAFDALKPARRYWVFAMLPVIEDNGLPLWLKMIAGAAVLASIQFVIESAAKKFRSTSAEPRGAADTGAGKSSVPP